MQKSLPPLQYLVAFEAAAKSRSFTKAATQLNLTQTAISKRIRLLELHLGEALFVRGARSLSLTSVGDTYLKRVERALDALRVGTSDVFGNSEQVVLTIRASHVFADQWIIPRLADFYERYPHISLRLITTVWNVETGDDHYDFDIRYGRGKWAGFETERLTDDHLVVLATPQTAATLKTPAAIFDHPLIEVMGYHEGWPEWFAAANIEDKRDQAVRLVDNSLSAMSMARAGLGVALIRSSLTEAMTSDGELVAPLEIAPPTQESFYLLYREGRKLSRAMVDFREWIVGRSGVGSLGQL